MKAMAAVRLGVKAALWYYWGVLVVYFRDPRPYQTAAAKPREAAATDPEQGQAWYRDPYYRRRYCEEDCPAWGCCPNCSGEKPERP